MSKRLSWYDPEVETSPVLTAMGELRLGRDFGWLQLVSRNRQTLKYLALLTGGRGVLRTIPRLAPSAPVTAFSSPVFAGVFAVFSFLVPSASSTIRRKC